MKTRPNPTGSGSGTVGSLCDTGRSPRAAPEFLGWATTRHIPIPLALSCILMLVGCSRAPKAATTSQKSVTQRVADLEQFVNGSGAPPPSGQDLNKEAEQDLAEIRSLGLVDRAQRDFANRLPGAAIENLRISYFRDTNVVWCNVTYKPRGGGEPRGQDFGYQRNGGTNWNLLWNEKNKP